jgi:phosphoenolpyruvate synthase/pyruvate phosphate dikinase
MICNSRKNDANDPARVGYKAANLTQLTTSGFRVPLFRIISVKHYVEFTSSPIIAYELDKLLTERAEDSAIIKLFISVPLPNNLKLFLQDTSDKLMSTSFVVRSSSTVEDIGNASFAGIFSSFVNVNGAGLEEKIRRVWASVHFLGVQKYCTKMGISTKQLKMAVIVQRYVPGFARGVMFTRGNKSNEIYIDVETHYQRKLEPPSHYRITRSGFNVSKHLYGASDCNILNEQHLRMLCQAAVQIEQCFKVAQDVEWIIDLEDTLYILQSRPVTIRNLD